VSRHARTVRTLKTKRKSALNRGVIARRAVSQGGITRESVVADCAGKKKKKDKKQKKEESQLIEGGTVGGWKLFSHMKTWRNTKKDVHKC